MSDKVPDKPNSTARAWGFGALILLCFAFVAASGLYMGMFFQPGPQDASRSVVFLEQSVPLGEFARSLHRWAALFCIFFIMAHFVRQCWRGAWRTAPKMMWIGGLVMTLLVSAEVVSGFMSHWDFRAYWILQTINNWLADLPIFADLARWYLEGSAAGEQIPIGRWFMTHVVILPALIIIFLASHLHLFYKYVAPCAKKICRLAPRIAVPAVGCFIIVVAAFGNIHLDAADPVTTTEWPQSSMLLLLFFQITRYCQDALEPLGFFWLPLCVFLVAVSLVFVDIGKWNKWLQYGSAGLFLALFIALGVVTHHSHSTSPLDSCAACHKEGFGNAFAVPPASLKELSDHYDNKWLALHYRYPQYYWMMDAQAPAW